MSKNKKMDINEILLDLYYNGNLSESKAKYVEQVIGKWIKKYLKQVYKNNGNVYFSVKCLENFIIDKLDDDRVTCSYSNNKIKICYRDTSIGEVVIPTVDDGVETQANFYKKLSEELDTENVSTENIMQILKYENLIDIDYYAIDEECKCDCCSGKCSCCCNYISDMESKVIDTIDKIMEIYNTFDDKVKKAEPMLDKTFAKLQYYRKKAIKNKRICSYPHYEEMKETTTTIDKNFVQWRCTVGLKTNCYLLDSFKFPLYAVCHFYNNRRYFDSDSLNRYKKL